MVESEEAGCTWAGAGCGVKWSWGVESRSNGLTKSKGVLTEEEGAAEAAAWADTLGGVAEVWCVKVGGTSWDGGVLIIGESRPDEGCPSLLPVALLTELGGDGGSWSTLL